MSVATATLRLSGATYRYAGARHDALTEVDLELTAGSVLGVVGPNEAGKSTLCLVAAGLAPIVVGGRLTGSVTIDGRETVGMRPHELAQRCGILFQDPQAQLSGTASTVFEELAFGPRNLGASTQVAAEAAGTATYTATATGYSSGTDTVTMAPSAMPGNPQQSPTRSSTPGAAKRAISGFKSKATRVFATTWLMKSQ